MDEQKTNIEITEEPAVDEMAEEVTEEASTQDMSAEAEKYEPILKRKACRKKTEKPDCTAKKSVCAAIAIGAACCTVLAAAGCALWLLNKCCEDKP